MHKASLLPMSKDFSLRRIFDQTYYAITENVVETGGLIIDVCTGAPPDVVTALVTADSATLFRPFKSHLCI